MRNPGQGGVESQRLSMYLFGVRSSILEAGRASARTEHDAWGPVPRVWLPFDSLCDPGPSFSGPHFFSIQKVRFTLPDLF